MGKKILYFVPGAVLIALGVLTIRVDGLAVILCGIGMLLNGLGSLIRCLENRKLRAASFLSMISAVFSVVIGIIVLMGSGRGQAFALRHTVFSLAFFLLGNGMLEILGAMIYRRVMKAVGMEKQAHDAVLFIVLGVVMILLGILGLLFPFVAPQACRAVVTLELFVTGFRLIWEAFVVGKG